MKVTKKAYGKVNFALNVYQGENGFHNLDTVVATVNICDKVTLTSRKDKLINLRVTGNRDYAFTFIKEKDNAYRAALAYQQKYDTNGVDIHLKKGIPLCSGMGGSSASASATLLAMEELFGCGDNLVDLANSLGSDTAYLLKGGFARLTGRGQIIQPIACDNEYEMVVIFPKGGVNTAECFSMYDQLIANGYKVDQSNVNALIDSFLNEELNYAECKNALLLPACELNSEVKSAVEFARTLSPKACFLTGSGSGVVLMFDYNGLSRWALSKLTANGFSAQIIKTLTPKE